MPLRTLADLAAANLLPAITPELERVADRYAIALTPALQNLIDPTNPHDPIAAQFLPQAAELHQTPDERPDPIGDEAHSPVKGLVHRYPDRVLLKPLLACAVYCRFCFRREQVGPDGGLLTPDELKTAYAYIAQNPQIREVILSGGDPLLLSDRRLHDIIARLNEIAQVKVLRLHSRIPVADPERITPELIRILRQRAPVYILLHCNHPRELTEAAQQACARLVEGGIPLLSQSVLLRGVNADPETLAALMQAFVENRIKPHYLHHPDLAPGTSHFRLPLHEAQELVRGLRGKLSGLCQPTYILDIPDGHGKIPVGPSFAEKTNEFWQLTDPQGQGHAYKDKA